MYGVKMNKITRANKAIHIGQGELDKPKRKKPKTSNILKRQYTSGFEEMRKKQQRLDEEMETKKYNPNIKQKTLSGNKREIWG